MRRLAACLLVLGALAACRPDTVRIAFRPEVGSTYRYVVDVRSVSTTRIDGAEPQRREEEVRLVAEHTVLARSGDGGVRVRVLVGEPGTAAQAFVVRFDRAAQLESIESVEGDQPDISGALGVPEIFPGAAGAPPVALGPGDEWSVDRRIVVPGTLGRTRLRVQGRLDQLGVTGDEQIARLVSTATLPLSTTTFTEDGTLEIEGRQRIAQRATYDLDDGAVRTVRSTTVGHFRLRVLPPPGAVADEVPGTLDVRVTSTTKRL